MNRITDGEELKRFGAANVSLVYSSQFEDLFALGTAFVLFHLLRNEDSILS
jgi:hypothetical protein